MRPQPVWIRGFREPRLGSDRRTQAELARWVARSARWASGAATTGGTQSPCAPPARADSIKPRVDSDVAKEDDKEDANTGAATGMPTKIVLGTGKELPWSEQRVERKETATVARVGSELRTEGLLWWPAATGDSVDPTDLINAQDAVPNGQ